MIAKQWENQEKSSLTFLHASTRIDAVHLVEKAPPTIYNDSNWILMETDHDWMKL